MNQSKMLNYLLGTTSKVEILRVLYESDDAMTGRRIASLAGISPRSCQLSLDSLVKNKALFRKAVGRAYSYTVNREHKMIWELLEPVFQKERVIHKEVIARVQKLARPSGPELVSLFWKLTTVRTGESAHFVAVINDKKTFPDKDLMKNITDIVTAEFGYDVKAEFVLTEDFNTKFLSSDKARKTFSRTYEKIKGAAFEELVPSKK